MGAVEAEGAGLYLRQAGAALDAGELLRELQLLAALHRHLHHSAAFPQSRLHRIGDAGHLDVFVNGQAVHHQFDVVPLPLVQVQVVGVLYAHDLAVDPYPGEARLAGSLEDFLMFAFAAAHLGGHDHDTAAFGEAKDGVHYLLHRLPGYRLTALGTVGPARPGK